MWEALAWLAIIAVVAVVAIGAVVALRYFGGGAGGGLGATFFRPKVEPRVFVVEQSAIDNKRRLVLIRRDDVEHLVMTGGPVDVVIETGIAARPMPVAAPDVADAAQAQPPADEVTADARFAAFDRFAAAPVAPLSPPTLQRASTDVGPQEQSEFPTLTAGAPLIERTG